MAKSEAVTIQPGDSYAINRPPLINRCSSETKPYKVVSGCALIKSGRGEFEVHPGDVIVIPNSPEYTIFNNGCDSLLLEPVKLDKPV